MTSSRSILEAAIASKPVAVAASGRVLTFPSMPASTWIAALAEEDLIFSVVPCLLNESGYDFIMDRLFEEKIGPKDLRRPAFDAISAASGFRWWEALSLVGLCESDPFVIGELTLRGVDPDRMPFGRWCTAVYALAIRGLGEKERMKWLAKFNAPPPIAEAMDESLDGDSFSEMIRGFRNIPGARQG